VINALLPVIDVQESLTIVTPLGVKFRDESTGTQVSDELVVTLHPAAFPELKIAAIENRSGVFVFRRLLGMREVENGAGDDAFWAGHPPAFDFVLEVSDRAGRFLPYAFPLQLPVRRLLTLPAASPLAASDAMPLFSAPSRLAPEVFGAIRAEVRDQVNGEPAAWALMEATTETGMVRGLADQRGQLLLPLPYPRPNITLGSPLHAGGPNVTDQSWNVGLTVRYAPRVPAPNRPDLEDILTQPIAFNTSATLHFGQELLLAPLLITPAGSPP
jgi:hypothetical protein